MTLENLMEALSLKVVCGDVKRSFDGVYAGDLLSRCMSHIEAGNLWITIMSNTNVVAVASLTETSAVLLAEGVTLIPDAEKAARENAITVLSSEQSAYELCAAIDRFTDRS